MATCSTHATNVQKFMKPYLLVLENFQSLRDRTEIPIGPLTFLYGPNSAGKSCVDDAFALFSSVFCDADWNSQALLSRWSHYAPAAVQQIKLQESITHLELHCQVGRVFSGLSETGSFDELVQCDEGLLGWFEKSGWNIVLRIEGTPNGVSALSLSAGTETVFRINMSDDADELQISLVAFGDTFRVLEKKHFADIKKRQKIYKFACNTIRSLAPWPSNYDGVDLDRDVIAIVNAMLIDLRGLEISPMNLGADRSTISDCSLSGLCGLRSDFYHAPIFSLGIRSAPEFDFMGEIIHSSFQAAYSEINSPSSAREPELRAAIDAALALNRDILVSSTEKLHTFVNRCLREHLFLDQGYQLVFEALEIKPATDLEVPALTAALMIGSLVDKTERRMTFKDVGTGISCVIPVLVAVHSGNAFIQQPELHLHPALQSALGDVFVEATKLQHAYHFIETHSEYILLRCLRRVRETTAGKHPEGSPLALKPEDLSVLYFEPQPGGSTKVKSIRVSTQGDFIDRWPRGFFEERGKELFDE